MKHLGMLVVMVCALAACGGKKANPNDKAVAQTVAFADAMCKCTDAPCVQKVTEEMTKAGEADKRPLSERMLEGDQQKKFDEAAKRITACAMKANGM